MMQTYYFQIPQAGKAWDECEPFTQKFKDRENAIAAAYLLSEVLKEQIRFTDNPYYKSNSGAYILHENASKAQQAQYGGAVRTCNKQNLRRVYFNTNNNVS